MAKRKFALRSLFAGRADRSTKDQEVEDFGSDSDEFNDAHPFDPSEVNRPPKLDSRIESELRKACAVVVDNLKPSGYDLEDTRMQSDILVDNPDVMTSRHPIPHKGLSIPQPGATWYQEGSARSSQIGYPSSAIKVIDKRSSGIRASGAPPEYDTLDYRASKYLQAQQEPISPPLDRPESPLAPLATEAVQSRALASPVSRRVAETDTTSGARNDSSSSMSNYAPSENGLRSSSTGATSANYTPSPTSKRASDAVRPEQTRTAAAAAAAGAWMKQEIERRRQAEEMYTQSQSHSQAIPEDASIVPDSTSNATQVDVNSQTGRSRLTAIAFADSDRNLSGGVNNSTSPTTTSPTYAPSGTLSGPFEQPSYVGNLTEDSHNPESPPKVEPVRGITFSKESRMPLEAQHSSKIQKLDVPNLAETNHQLVGQDTLVSTEQDKNIVSGKSKRRESQRLSKENPLLQSQGQPGKSPNGTLSPTSPASPGLPKPRSNWPVPPKPNNLPDNIPQIPPLPNRHRFDDTIVVKDFVQPPIAPRPTALQKSISTDKRPVRQGDVEAADFDSFMSAVEERGDDDTVVTKLDSPSPVESPEQASPEMNGANASNIDDPPEPQAVSSLSEMSNGDISPQPAEHTSPVLQNNRAISPIENGDTETGPQHRPLSQPMSSSELSSRPQSEPSPLLPPPLPQSPQQRAARQLEHRQVLSPPIPSPRTVEQRSPAVFTSSRTSISASVAASGPTHSRSQSLSKKSPSGFKRIFKLGNSERGTTYVNSGYGFTQRKIYSGYAPGAYVPGYGLNGGGIEEDEERFDEQACAAPVVGFGRGW